MFISLLRSKPESENIFDVSARFSCEFRMELVKIYCFEELDRYVLKVEIWIKSLAIISLFRIFTNKYIELSFQESNQLIRGSALRVLTSIRVAMISPIMMLAIKDSVRDMSPYVRKVPLSPPFSFECFWEETPQNICALELD